MVKQDLKTLLKILAPVLIVGIVFYFLKLPTAVIAVGFLGLILCGMWAKNFFRPLTKEQIDTIEKYARKAKGE